MLKGTEKAVERGEREKQKKIAKSWRTIGGKESRKEGEKLRGMSATTKSVDSK